VISDRAGCAEDLGQVPGNRVFASGDADDLAERLREALEGGPLDRDYFLERWNYGKFVEGLKQKNMIS